MFSRHVENERLLFMGSVAFVRAFLKILTRSITDEAAKVMKENFLDDKGIRDNGFPRQLQPDSDLVVVS